MARSKGQSEAQFLELVEAALDACECDHAEVILTRTNHSLTRFAESVIHQNVAETDARLSVRAVLGKRIAAARTNQLTMEAARETAQRARALVEVAAEDPHFSSLAAPQPIPRVENYAAATAESTPEARAAAIREIVQVTQREQCLASGSLSAEMEEVAIGNSLGVRAYTPATQASFVTVVADDTSSGYAEWHGNDISRFSARTTAETATWKCVTGRGIKTINPGIYTVILEPPAVGDMLSLLTWAGFGANAFQENRSFMSGHIGERVVGENISVWDDATDPRGLTFPFDWEGVGKRKVMLIENGIARSVAYDTYTARKEHKETTGHALPQPNTYGPFPTNLFMNLGDASLEEMIASTERGLLVTRFHYTNIIHERLTTITGMTRDGTFFIENGKVAHPVQNLRFTQSIIDALSAVEMIGREGQLTESGYVPAVKVGKFNFTS